MATLRSASCRKMLDAGCAWLCLAVPGDPRPSPRAPPSLRSRAQFLGGCGDCRRIPAVSANGISQIAGGWHSLVLPCRLIENSIPSRSRLEQFKVLDKTHESMPGHVHPENGPAPASSSHFSFSFARQGSLARLQTVLLATSECLRCFECEGHSPILALWEWQPSRLLRSQVVWRCRQRDHAKPQIDNECAGEEASDLRSAKLRP